MVTHRLELAFLACAIAICTAWSLPVCAQSTPPGGHQQDNSGLNGSMSREDLARLSGDHKQDTNDLPRATPAERAKAKDQSAKLVSTLGIRCEISDAQLVVSGTRKPASGGREVDTRVYEVACSGKMGYLLESQGTANPVAISCLAAEEARASDAEKGRQPGFFCKLPGNRDVHATVAALIAAGTGAQCPVQRLQYFGKSESTQSEYSEVVCADGKGFLLRIALPGSSAENLVMGCADAAKQGIKCRLTDTGPVETPVTMDTFKSALAQHGVSCTIDQIRMIGQEDHRKRYVVEYLCAAPGAGGIAFLPLEGNSNPYEALDCPTAATQGLACALAPAK
jgi:hypothetical protein